MRVVSAIQIFQILCTQIFSLNTCSCYVKIKNWREKVWVKEKREVGKRVGGKEPENDYKKRCGGGAR